MAIIHSLKYSVLLLFVVPLFVTRCHLVSFVVTRSHSLSLIVTHCHSLSLAVTHCTTHCHSLYHLLSFVVIRCHSLSLDVPLVCLFINDPILGVAIFIFNIILNFKNVTYVFVKIVQRGVTIWNNRTYRYSWYVYFWLNLGAGNSVGFR